MKFCIRGSYPDIQVFYKNHSTFHDGDSGLDLFITEDTVIHPHETKLVDLGISCQLRSLSLCPWKWIRGRFWNYHSYLMVPRSSLAKTPLILHNSIGLIDKGYTGNLKAAFYNTSNEPVYVRRGQRYVQLVNPNLSEISYTLVSCHRDTSRGDSGFGSTGGI